MGRDEVELVLQLNLLRGQGQVSGLLLRELAPEAIQLTLHLHRLLGGGDGSSPISQLPLSEELVLQSHLLVEQGRLAGLRGHLPNRRGEGKVGRDGGCLGVELQGET